MTDMRRTLLWGVFLVSLFLIYDAWNRHTGHPSMFAPPPAKRAAAPAAPSSSPTDVPVASGAPAVPVPGANAVPGAASPAASAASQRFDITTDLMKVTLDSVGGDVVRVELLKQVDEFDKTKNVVLLDHSSERLYKAQTGLTPGGLPNHLSPMTVMPGDRALKDGSNELQVRLESAEAGGAKLVKTFTFRRGSHVIGVRHEVVNTATAPISPQLYLQLRRDGNPPPGGSSFYSTFTGPAVYTDASKFQKVDFSDIADRRPNDKPEHDLQADNGWVGMVQHYFASAWLLGASGDEKRQREFYTRKLDGNEYVVGMIVPLGEVAPGTSKAIDTRLFVGPQEEAQLEKIAPGLELVKDYGVLTILAKPLFWLLSEMHKILGNWGWAIVALVVLLKIAFYWLNASAYRSMAKMKAIGPKVQDLRERFKDKPQQMQQEMMRIYREEKVNPLGGCLPILVQMPFFIALYWVLLSSVEMRHAPWIGWITDLSAKDPYFILPILMTVTSMIQVALGAKPPDPVQARMMWLMPLAFSVMFFFFPAGLVLYWLTNNILSIAQQYLINKQMGVAGK